MTMSEIGGSQVASRGAGGKGRGSWDKIDHLMSETEIWAT